jgi:hypothetical protein
MRLCSEREALDDPNWSLTSGRSLASNSGNIRRFFAFSSRRHYCCGKSGSNRRDDESMVLSELVPMLACRNMSSAGFVSS